MDDNLEHKYKGPKDWDVFLSKFYFSTFFFLWLCSFIRCQIAVKERQQKKSEKGV